MNLRQPVQEFQIGGTGCRIHFASGLPVSESSVPLPVLVFFAVSSTGVPSASLSVGAFGAGSAAQTLSRNSTVFSWLAFAFATACSGTPHAVLLSARNFTTFASDSTKRVTAPHMTLRSWVLL